MPRNRIQVELRRLVEQRAYYCCEYCRCQAAFATQSLSVEHIVPVHLGGDNSLDNLALACQGCNSHKYTKLIIGISSIGRATVEALKLNRPGLMNLRRVLYTLGEHPPMHD